MKIAAACALGLLLCPGVVKANLGDTKDDLTRHYGPRTHWDPNGPLIGFQAEDRAEHLQFEKSGQAYDVLLDKGVSGDETISSSVPGNSLTDLEITALLHANSGHQTWKEVMPRSSQHVFVHILKSWTRDDGSTADLISPTGNGQHCYFRVVARSFANAEDVANKASQKRLEANGF